MVDQNEILGLSKNSKKQYDTYTQCYLYKLQACTDLCFADNYIFK